MKPMKRKKRSSKEKLMIVLEGLKGTVPLAELCSRHAITQSQYYIWRDRLLKDGEAIFSFGGFDKEQERLQKENSKLKGIIGELTVELKKTEKILGQW